MSSILSLSGIFVFFTILLFLTLFPLWRSADASRKKVLLVAFLVTPLLCIYSYHRLGAYQDLIIRDEYQRMGQLATQGQEVPEAQWQALLDRIRNRAESHNKGEYWYLLAGSYEEQQQYDLAAEAYEHAAESYPEDATILSRWAESEFINQGYNLTPKVEEIAQRVLQLDPSNAVVLGLLGIAAFQDGQIEPAIQFWNMALVNLPPMSENAQIIQASIIRAQQFLASLDGDAEQLTPVNEAAGIALRIQMSAEIEAAPETTIFVFARIPGSPIPTAVNRLTVADLPAEIILDNSMVMIPGTNLMSIPVLELVARLSFSGQPTAQTGDYEVIASDIVPADLDASLELIISEIID